MPQDETHAYIQGFEGEIHHKLQELRSLLTTHAPEAEERIAYGIPTLWAGGNLIHYGAGKNHIALYPASKAIEVFRDRLTPYHTSKGTIRFPLGQDLPIPLILDILHFRQEELQRELLRKNQGKKLTVRVEVEAPLERVFQAYTTPSEIKAWNQASPEWHCPKATLDLRVGGEFHSTMAAKDGSASFDFWGTYTLVDPPHALAYTMGDGRKATIAFKEGKKKTQVKVVFEAERENPLELQQQGWQSILDSFRRHLES